MNIEHGKNAAIRDAIRRTRLFADLPANIVGSLAYVSRLHSYANGEKIVGWGEDRQSMALIVSGCIVSARNKANGRRLVFDLAQAGQIMGTFGAFDEQPSPLDNYARGETTVVLIPYGPFRDIVLANSSLAAALIAMHTRRSRLDFERMMLALDPLRVRVAKVLLYLGRGPEQPEPENPLPIRILQDDVADMLGVTRASANREIVRMVQDGVLTWNYGHVVIRSTEALTAIASEDSAMSPDFARVIRRSGRHFHKSD